MATMKDPSRDDVIAALKQYFPGKDPDIVLALNDQYGPNEPERERVQLAILKSSGRNAYEIRLQVAVEAAKRDYQLALRLADARPSREDVIAAVRRDFPTDDPDTVLAILDQYGYGEYKYGPERERVQLAILRLSRGNIQWVHDGVRLANVDYRDGCV